MALNTGYLTTNRGIVKILQITFGIISCSLLCLGVVARSCFYDWRAGYASSLDFVCLIINIVLFLLVFLNVAVYRLERLYSLIGFILFMVAFGLMIWFFGGGEVLSWPICSCNWVHWPPNGTVYLPSRKGGLPFIDRRDFEPFMFYWSFGIAPWASVPSSIISMLFKKCQAKPV